MKLCRMALQNQSTLTSPASSSIKHPLLYIISSSPPMIYSGFMSVRHVFLGYGKNTSLFLTIPSVRKRHSDFVECLTKKTLKFTGKLPLMCIVDLDQIATCKSQQIQPSWLHVEDCANPLLLPQNSSICGFSHPEVLRQDWFRTCLNTNNEYNISTVVKL